MAYHLLGAYKSISVLVQRLDQEDKDNIAALMVDPKYKSFVKLQDNLKANWSQLVLHKRVPADKEDIYRGGIQLLQLVQNDVLAEFKHSQEERGDAEQKKEILEGIGW